MVTMTPNTEQSFCLVRESRVDFYASILSGRVDYAAIGAMLALGPVLTTSLFLTEVPMKLRTLKLSLRLAFLAAMLVSIVSLSSPTPASASYCSHLCENHCSSKFWD